MSEDERKTVVQFIGRGQAHARTMTRGHSLLKSAEGWRIERLAATYHVSQARVRNVRQRYRDGGLERGLADQVPKNRRRALGGQAEAVMAALAGRPVPDGPDPWTLRLLRDQLMELEVVDPVSAATLQDRLKKMPLNRGSESRGVCRKRSPEAVWRRWQRGG